MLLPQDPKVIFEWIFKIVANFTFWTMNNIHSHHFRFTHRLIKWKNWNRSPFSFIQSPRNSFKYGGTATSKNPRPTTAAINSKHTWIRTDDHNLNNDRYKIHSDAISSTNPTNVQRKKQNHFAIKHDPAFNKFHRSKYKIVNVKPGAVASNTVDTAVLPVNQHGSINESASHHASTSPMVCPFDFNKTINRNDKSKYVVGSNSNYLTNVPANEQNWNVESRKWGFFFRSFVRLQTEQIIENGWRRDYCKKK